MTPALDPAIAAYLPGAAQALFAVASFIIAILVILARMRKWLKELFLEFSQSDAFRHTVRVIVEEVVQRKDERIDQRILALEQANEHRADTQRKLHEKADRLMVAFSDHRQWTADQVIRLTTKKGEP